MIRFFTTLGLLAVLMFSTIGASCSKDTQSALADGYSASVRIATYGTDLTRSFTQLRHDGAISQAVFDDVIAKLKLVDSAGHALNKTLNDLITKYPDGNVPPAEFSPLALAFNTDIYTPVFDIIATAAKLSPANQALVSLALSGIKLATNTIRSLMNKHSAALGLPEIKERYDYGVA
jgi:hypothetical protein